MPKTSKPMKTTELPPVVKSARRAIRRALPELSTVQLLRLAVTAEVLAYGEDRGKWSLSLDWAEQQQAQPSRDGPASHAAGGVGAV